MGTEYEIIRSLGTGATAEVFLVRDGSQRMPFAVKKIAPHIIENADSVKRIHREIETLATLHHPNIVEFLGVNESEAEISLKLEYVEGSHLKAWREQNSHIPYEPLYWILTRVLRALGHAHEKSILHRDLKPENVLVSTTGEIKLTDFGLSRSLSTETITRLGMLVGSLAYLAPEVIDGDKSSQRSDIFSFGVLAYELLAQRSPYEASSPQSLIRAVMADEFTPLQELGVGVDLKVCEIINSCLLSDPQLRPMNVWTIESALMTILDESQLLMDCQDWISQSEEKTSIQNLWKKKYDVLSTDLAKISYAESPNIYLAKYQELQCIFPESQGIEEYRIPFVGQIQGSTDNARKKKILALLILLLIFFSGIFFWSKEKQMSSSKVVSQIQAPAEPEQRISAPVENIPEKINRKKTRPAEARQKAEKVAPKPYGFISFRIPSDAKVYLKKKLVKKEDLLKVKTSLGRNEFKIIRPGYLPIKSQVMVKNGKVAIVNVGTEKP